MPWREYTFSSLFLVVSGYLLKEPRIYIGFGEDTRDGRISTYFLSYWILFQSLALRKVYLTEQKHTTIGHANQIEKQKHPLTKIRLCPHNLIPLVETLSQLLSGSFLILPLLRNFHLRRLFPILAFPLRYKKDGHGTDHFPRLVVSYIHVSFVRVLSPCFESFLCGCGDEGGSGGNGVPELADRIVTVGVVEEGGE